MDNSENKNQFYIVSLDNGIREEEPISIEVFNSFNDGSQLVQLNNTVFGVYKNNSSKPETMYIDDYDIIKADIAELLDIEHEETRRIVTEDTNAGIFTSLNYSKDIETRVSATTALTHLVNYMKSNLISQEDVTWITSTLGWPKTEKGNAIKDKTQIENLIRLSIFTMCKEIEVNLNAPLPKTQRDAINKNFIRMILFDLIVDRKYRGLDYYIITSITETGIPVWTDAHLSPISVSNSVEKDAVVGPNEYMLNNYLVDKTVLLDVLFESFYRETKKVTEALNDAKRLYTDAISRIIYNNTELDKAIELEKKIEENISRINQKQEQIEKENNKTNKINKVERTMATQSLNVKVTAKLDLIQKKYPISPKDHPEIFKEKRSKLDKMQQDELKLIVEEEKKNNAGFAVSLVIISIVALICGIGIGIAYVLLSMGN